MNNILPKTLSNILQSRKEKFLQKIELSSSGAVFVHWLLTNWVTVLIILVASGVYLVQYVKVRDLRESLLKTQIEALNLDLENAKIEKEKLLIRIKDLDRLTKESLVKSKRVKKDAVKLTAQQKRELLLAYKNRGLYI